MHTAYAVEPLRQSLRTYRASGDRIALVPTMGNLHRGHMALVERARAIAERVVVSLFVNPTQFGPGEDYESYPSTFEADRDQLVAAGVDLLFVPSVATVYPDGEGAVTVHVDRVTEGLCGDLRPGHFSGVATVVTKLLALVQPDVALFGKKDYQQWVTVRRLVRNLLMDIAIEAVETVREDDGLAASSRNSYLNPEERQRATALYAAFRDGVEQAKRQGWRIPTLERSVRKRLEASDLAIDYLAVRRAGDLEPVSDLQGPRVILGAVRVGPTRLIDNLEFDLTGTAGFSP